MLDVICLCALPQPYADMTVPAVWRAPWGGIRAPEHHSEANRRSSQRAGTARGAAVVAGARPRPAARPIRDPDPVIFFEPKRIYRQYKEEVPDDGDAAARRLLRAADAATCPHHLVLVKEASGS